MVKKNTQIRRLVGAMSASALTLGLVGAANAAGPGSVTVTGPQGPLTTTGSSVAPSGSYSVATTAMFSGATSGVAGTNGAQATDAEVIYNSNSGGNNSTTSANANVNAAAGPFAPAKSINITYSRHNLGSQNKISSNHTATVLSGSINSITGATVGQDNYVVGTNQICVFCHTPHGFNTVQSGPLWNKQVHASSVYTVYNAGTNNSSTLDADAPSLGSVSLACLSCHDGTQAMDNMINAAGSGGMVNGYDATLQAGLSGVAGNTSANYNYANVGAAQGYIWGTGDGTNGFAFMGQGGSGPSTLTGSTTGDTPALEGIDLGTDLSNDHPISVQYCGGGIYTAQSGTTAQIADGTCRDRLFNLPTTAQFGGKNEFWIDTNIILDTDAINAGAASTGGIGAYPITRDPNTIELYVTDSTTPAVFNTNSVLMQGSSSVVMPGSCGVGVNGDACGRGFIQLVAASTSITSSVSNVQAPGGIAMNPAALSMWANQGTLAGGFGVRTKQDLILFTNNPGVKNSPSVECASCHDPHTPNNGTFLRVSNAGSGLCLSCHVK